MKKDRLVVAETFNTEIDAQIARAFLQSRGVASTIMKDDLDGLFPNLQLTEGVALLVRDEDVKRAALLLKSHKKERGR